ncbi:hypothetical protein [Streptomyces sp. NPDC046976]|uniref:hypothetical protein n=1 Tax=Streptomyces sp. NPDC046976 TaxID=3155258 RepID=UPI0033E6FCA6
MTAALFGLSGTRFCVEPTDPWLRAMPEEAGRGLPVTELTEAKPALEADRAAGRGGTGHGTLERPR